MPIWTEFVRGADGGVDPDAFPVPDDIVWRDVDPISGDLATPDCPERRHEPFLVGTEPTTPCTRHRAVWSAVEHGVGEVGRALGEGSRRLGSWFGRLFR